jgi:hypothetical protein
MGSQAAETIDMPSDKFVRKSYETAEAKDIPASVARLARTACSSTNRWADGLSVPIQFK